MMRSSVDLPEPDGPSSAVSEPVSTSTETSSSAWKSAEPLRDVVNLDAHAASLGFSSVIATRTMTEMHGEHE